MKPDTIQKNDKIYAKLVNPFDNDLNSTKWLGETYESLQGSVMRYDEKEFRNHKHILNPRIIKRTQEVFVVIKGKVSVSIYDSKNQEFLGELTASVGEAIFVWDGYHKVAFLEKDTVAYEIKAGSFSCVSDDKEFFQ